MTSEITHFKSASCSRKADTLYQSLFTNTLVDRARTKNTQAEKQTQIKEKTYNNATCAQCVI